MNNEQSYLKIFILIAISAGTIFIGVIGYREVFKYRVYNSDEPIKQTFKDLPLANPPAIIEKIKSGVNFDFDIASPSCAISSKNVIYCLVSREIRLDTARLIKNTQAPLVLLTSFDNGKTWSKENIAAATDAAQTLGKIVIDSNDKIHIIWIGFDQQNNDNLLNESHIYYQSKKSGIWSPIVRISDSISNAVSIAVDSKNIIHLIFSDTNGRVIYKKIPEEKISDEIVIVTLKHPTRSLTIAIDLNDNVHLIHSNSNGGLTHLKIVDNEVGRAENITIPPREGGDQAPSIAIDFKNNIHVVWSRGVQLDGNHAPWQDSIMYQRFNGNRWEAPIEISVGLENTQGSPSVSIDKENNVYITWHTMYVYDYAGPNPRVMSGQFKTLPINSVNKPAPIFLYPFLLGSMWPQHSDGSPFNITSRGYALAKTEFNNFQFIVGTDSIPLDIYKMPNLIP